MASYLKLTTTFHASQNKSSFHVSTPSPTLHISRKYPHIHMTMSTGSSSSSSSSSLSLGGFGTQKRDMNLKVAHVATKLVPPTRRVTDDVTEVIAPPLPPLPRTQKEETKNDGGRLAAWTSIRQERWEGELQVEGDIPLWLVN